MEVNNLTNVPVDTDLVWRTVKVVLEGEKEQREVSVVFVEKEKIKELNRIYRGKDSVTDVLSFFYNEKDFLGEVVICPEEVSKRKKEDFTKEVCRVTIHGALHLLGYHHENDAEEKLVEEKTESYLQKVQK